MGLTRLGFPVPELGLLFLVLVVGSAYTGGWRAGLIGAALSWVYGWLPFLMDDKLSPTFEGNIPPFVVPVASSLVLVLFTCLLRPRAGRVAAVPVPRRTFESRSVAALQSLGVALIATDAEGRITGWNEVAESLTGWTKAKVLGRQLAEVCRFVHGGATET